jgi:hypothetical protein
MSDSSGAGRGFRVLFFSFAAPLKSAKATPNRSPALLFVLPSVLQTLLSVFAKLWSCESEMSGVMFGVSPTSGRIRVETFSEGEAKARHLIRVWWLLRNSPFFRRQLRSTRIKKKQAKKKALKAKRLAILRKTVKAMKAMKKSMKAMKKSMKAMKEQIAFLQAAVSDMQRLIIPTEPDLFAAPTPPPTPPQPPTFTLMCMVGGNDVVALDVRPSDTIDDVKAKMRTERGLGDDVEISVFWDGDEVDGLTLSELGIDSSEVLVFCFAV